MVQEAQPEYTFSYVVETYAHPLHEEPHISTGETIPLAVFSTEHSPLQALIRYLVDKRGKSLTQTARLLGRSPKTAWASYHQNTTLPEINEDSLPIPLSIFSTPLTPLESLVRYLRQIGLRNSEIASALQRDPRTIWTVAKRGEAKR